MKIRIKEKPFSEVLNMPAEKHKKPLKQPFIMRLLLKIASLPDLWATRFSCKKIGMERLKKDQPCLYLMNHCSFIDLEIASSIIFPRRFNIICTQDGLVGKRLLMRLLGCIPTKKFVQESRLVRDMVYAVRKLNSSVLMFPEASYSFDGTTTVLPTSLGKCIKLLGVPVVMITGKGTFLRDPLYNGLQRRKVKVSADMEYLLSPEEIAKMSVDEINKVINEKFDLDYFKLQQENGVRVTEKFRADFLNRPLFKCAHCFVEGSMVGKGTTLTCNACGKVYELTEDGFLKAQNGETEFSHVPDWYAWQRSSVRREIENGDYNLDVPVDIYVLRDTKCLYKVGKGRLEHSVSGFSLNGCDGELSYTQSSAASYSLYSDFYCYEIGDVIVIGNSEMSFYCFPTEKGDFVAKTRIATEEIYKMLKEKQSTKA